MPLDSTAPLTAPQIPCDQTLADEDRVIDALLAEARWTSAQTRSGIQQRATALVEALRADTHPALMELFLAEYGLSTEEGVALMCLAEALLRVPDSWTIDALIEDKIAPSAWGQHLGQSTSSLVNASTWGLMLTGRLLRGDQSPGVLATLHGLTRRLGEPVIRSAVKAAIKELGRQFVLGESIDAALRRGAAERAKGFSHSFDMLGEAALTNVDAQKFYRAYEAAIERIAAEALASDFKDNPGISIKLSALHPRYEAAQRDAVMAELVPKVRQLAWAAKMANLGLTIDAEEMDRLDLSLEVIAAVLSDPALAGWDGFGMVVQSYGKRAAQVIDWFHALAVTHDRRVTLRLVKGAYWDSEIKKAQVKGLADYPVLTFKQATDVAYLCCAERLLALTDRIYPQFATHNACTVAAILEMAGDRSDRAEAFEFQRLHGMGEALHRLTREAEGTRCRIYAPVGPHRDLLAYLVRRMLENGSNSSFVNQIVDQDVPVNLITRDPLGALRDAKAARRSALPRPADLFGPGRINARGWNLDDPQDQAEIAAARAPHLSTIWQVEPLLAAEASAVPSTAIPATPRVNPAKPDDLVCHCRDTTGDDLQAALQAATDWQDCPTETRSAILRNAADLYEQNFGAFFALLAREAGKTQADANAELREAVDFLRYYAQGAPALAQRPARGLFACISPWNFPLAIFTGQIAAALASGNGVIAKPAEQTPATAFLATQLLHQAGVPRAVLQLLPGDGATLGAALVGDPRLAGVCFTGSTDTAQAIHRAMAATGNAAAPLIAETGGLNAMVVDSTALPEQAIKDVIASAFQSAGQRCSALRVLYVQEDIAEPFLDMLRGAMDRLVLGDPWDLHTDIGPVIDAEARAGIEAHIKTFKAQGAVLHQIAAPQRGCFVGPTVLKTSGIGALEREVFGPVLHLVPYAAQDLPKILQDINASGFGLTFGLHSRIDQRVEQVSASLKVGNLYVNRNQIGAIVGSQPFGGEGLSGTGPKAGGPQYLLRFTQGPSPAEGQGPAKAPSAVTPTPSPDLDQLQNALTYLGHQATTALSTQDMPGPTGESNRLSTYARDPFLCLGPGAEAAESQRQKIIAAGGRAIALPEGLPAEALDRLNGFGGVVWWGNSAEAQSLRQALAARSGPILPLVTEGDPEHYCLLERHLCVDVTAAGGNTALLSMG